MSGALQMMTTFRLAFSFGPVRNDQHPCAIFLTFRPWRSLVCSVRRPHRAMILFATATVGSGHVPPGGARSIPRYVEREQSCRRATVFSHSGDDWVGHVLTSDDDLALPEVGITLPIAELYEGVTFPPGPGEALLA
jgi:hypothetical protein